MGELTYLIRYGVMGHVGRFRGLPRCGGPFDRGQAVVIQSHRGVELGEVLVLLDATAAPDFGGRVERPAGEDARPIEKTDVPHVLRAAAPDDLARAENVNESRSSRFTRCQSVLEEEGWPWELLDVEPLLDGQATVLHFLGPHELDEASVRARFRVLCDFDVVLEPIGADLEEYESEVINPENRCGSGGDGSGVCGSGGCGSGGGCGVTASSQRGATVADAEISQGSGEPASHGGCASCGISQWKTARSHGPASST